MKLASETRIYPKLSLDPVLVYSGIKLEHPELFVSGQWNFAKSTVLSNHNSIYHELPWGLGLTSPIVYNESTNQLLSKGSSPPWYENAFINAYLNMNKIDPPLLRVHKRFVAEDIYFVNCLMPHYGDCLSILMRTGCLQPQKRSSVALVPTELVRLVPDWYAEIWELETADIGIPGLALQWNHRFNSMIQQQFLRFNSVSLPHLFQPAAPSDMDTLAFTGTVPFSLTSSKFKPTVVTFLWREQRLSPPEFSIPVLARKILQKTFAISYAEKLLKIINLLRYMAFIKNVCRIIREEFPDCRFNIIGLGRFPPCPPWIFDHRVIKHSADADKNDESIVSNTHVLISAHGSHLVGLSSLAGCVIQLIPDHKWVNWLDALSIRNRDHGGWINYLSIPSGVTPVTLASVISSRIHNNQLYQFAYSSSYSGLLSVHDIQLMRRSL